MIQSRFLRAMYYSCTSNSLHASALKSSDTTGWISFLLVTYFLKENLCLNIRFLLHMYIQFRTLWYIRIRNDNSFKTIYQIIRNFFFKNDFNSLCNAYTAVIWHELIQFIFSRPFECGCNGSVPWCGALWKVENQWKFRRRTFQIQLVKTSDR